MNPSLNLRPLGALLLVGLLIAPAAAGCTSAKDKATKVITEAVQDCRDAPADSPLYTVKVAGAQDDEILKLACDEPIENVEMEDNLIATAYTGPVQWEAHLNNESKVWVLTGASWSDLNRARRALEESDPSEEQLNYAVEHLERAQSALPQSPWLRLRRLEALLDLRTKERGPKTEDAETIGTKASAQYDETIAWAEENDSLDTSVEAQYLVAQHLRRYLERIAMILSSDGSSDEWLEKAAEDADKEGDSDKAEQYRQELKEAQEEREETREIFGERQVKVSDSLCEQLGKLSPAGLDDSDLQSRVVAIKEAVDCMDRAAPAE